jgi:adenylate cyclase
MGGGAHRGFAKGDDDSMSRLPLTAFGVSLLGTLALMALYGLSTHSTLMRNLEAKALDLRFQLRGVQPPTAPVTLVVVDDRSIAELGRWPWTRRRFAEVVQRLREAGAKVIGFDLLFAEAEVPAEHGMLQRFRQALETFGFPLQKPAQEAMQQALRQMEEAADPDLALAAAVREAGNVVLAFAVTVGPPLPHDQPPRAPPPYLARSAYRTLLAPAAGPSHLAVSGPGLLLPIASLGEAAAALGHVNLAFDSDGTPRYEYPVVPYAGAYYPSFAVQVVRQYLGLRPEEVKVAFGEGIQLGPLFIPTDESTRLLVAYVGPRGTFPSYAFVDVLQGRLPAAAFKDAIVLIGGAATGLSDTVVTPFSAALPGVERHATIIESILRQNFLHRRQATALIDLLCIVVMGLLVGWLSPRCPTFWGTLVAVGLAAAYLLANVAAFIYAGLWVNLLFPLFAVVLNQGGVTLFKFMTEERQKRLIRQAFQYYLHPAIVDQVSQHPHLLKLGGEARELTVLFSDIRGFSAIAETLSPERLVRLLNDYLTAMTQVVFQYGGLLDKYTGDGLMAVYGAPLPTDEHAFQACCTALDMVDALRALQARPSQAAMPRFRIGIGINTAVMVVGNMGSELRFDYTVMGDGVNLASRLEGANKEYGTTIIISEATWARVKDRLATRELDIIRAHGKAQPTRIFEVLGRHPLPPALLAMVQAFETGLSAYRARRWEEATRCFQRALDLAPGDPPSQLYLQRCKAFMAAPPPPDWDGVYAMTTK